MDINDWKSNPLNRHKLTIVSHNKFKSGHHAYYSINTLTKLV